MGFAIIFSAAHLWKFGYLIGIREGWRKLHRQWRENVAVSVRSVIAIEQQSFFLGPADAVLMNGNYQTWLN